MPGRVLTVRELVVWMTCSVDGRDHAVTGSHADTASERERGIYAAVCGRLVAPKSMVSPPGPRCQACCLLIPVLYGQRRQAE